MRTAFFLIAIIAGGDLFAQSSVLEALTQPTQSADFEVLNQANQATQILANSASKRASLLQRRADELRSQLTRLEDEVDKLRAEQAALKSAVVECRDRVVTLVKLLEKRDFASIATPLEELRALYTKSLLPKLLPKEPEPSIEAPEVVNPPAPRVQKPTTK